MSRWEVEDVGFGAVEELFDDLDDMQETLEELGKDMDKDISRLKRIPFRQWTEGDLVPVSYYCDELESLRKKMESFYKKHGW